MTQAWRLERGGHIDRSRPLAFTWDGTSLAGYQGDTLASALLANGVHLVGRSFKYHRPRGIVAAGSEEPNALITLRDGPGREDPNTRATVVPLRDGLAAFSQNCWPSLQFDVGVLNNIFSPLWSAGFYYKTFMWPRRAWHALYEPFIRNAAGLGRAPSAPDPDQYTTRYAHCDVLVVGAGPAGIAAALTAADAGANVILCDEQHAFGGSILSGSLDGMGRTAVAWRQNALDVLTANKRVTCLPSTTAFGYYADNMLGLLQDLPRDTAAGSPRQRMWQVRARQVVLATGSIERPIVFPGNDRPGVLLAGAARTYLNRYAVRVGSAAVVYASDDSGYQSALDLHKQTGAVRAIVDPRPLLPDELSAQALDAGIEVLGAHAVFDTSGSKRISAALVGPVNGSASTRSIACDALLMAGGWTPTVHLFSQTRSPLTWSEEIQEFVPGTPRQATWVAGACRGLRTLGDCIADGELAGDSAAQALRASRSTRRAPLLTRRASAEAAHLAALDRIAAGRKAFVDFQNDVCATDLTQALREGFQSVEHLKRYTTTGMATDQGKTSNLNALSLAARTLNTVPHAVGTTTFRAPYTPVTFGALAGEHRGAQLDPVRRTPMHDRAVRQNAVFEPVALWQRARYFPIGLENMEAAVLRECRITRERAGIFDASTLGKIEVVGPDAEQFLDRLYTNAWAALRPGRCRYGLLLREDGFVYDDGVVARVAPDRFHVTTTTGGAARVLHHMEDYLQTEFPNLKVWLTSTTEEWAVVAVNGPLARHILAPLVEGIDLSAEAFPHMSFGIGRVCGFPARVFRVSFTGELGFEVNVPASAGPEVWDAIQHSGNEHGAVTYGTETMHVLRAEKGYIIVGQETDGTVTPHDLGLEWTLSKTKKDFVGKRGLTREDLVRSDRKQLVGLLTRDGATLLEEGAQIVSAGSSAPRLVSEGHVTSSYRSAAVGRPIALALLAGGRSRIGSTVHVPTLSGRVEAEVVSPMFYDAAGARLHG